MSPQVPESEAAKIREELFAGRKIGAIKLLREATGLGLKDAKDVVEKLDMELRQTSPEKFTAKKGAGCAGVLVCCLLFVVCSACLVSAAFGATKPGSYLKKDGEWFKGDEARQIAAYILSWQSQAGSWPKNTDIVGMPFVGDRKTIKGTFDNGATCDEIRFLGRVFQARADEKCREAAVKGIDHLLAAQYANGGWPQYFPPDGYAKHITFNDEAMVRVMILAREIGNQERWNFLEDQRRAKAREAFERGVECILKCQIRDEKSGKLLAWCAQHDEITFQPRPARSYELPSLSGSESVGIVRLLMSIDKPSPQLIAAVEGAVEWMKAARIPGIKQVEVDDKNAPKGKDKRVVEDIGGPGLWARFYEIDTGRPFFCDRDGVKKYSLAEIGYERRNGYGWLGEWPRALIEKEYPEWKKKIKKGN